MAYTNAIFYVDMEGGNDAARANLAPTVYANNGSGAVRVTCSSTAAYSTDAVFDIAGTTGNVYAGGWKVTIVSGTNVDLQGSTFTSNPVAKGTMIPRGGSSKTDAWKTFGSGATGARLAPGDTVRTMSSPDPTLVGNATWTNNSKTITLASAVTTTITDCETAWTASANVTATAYTGGSKTGTKAAQFVIAAGFTTGLVAYFPTGTLDLSNRQQVKLWCYQASTAIVASTYSIRLCTDTVGAVSVHTIAIPAQPNYNTWVAFTVDLNTNLNSAIQSVALYADLDPGAVTFYLDCIIACSDDTAADSLSLTSLIGKVHNLSWVASTSYAADTVRRPTVPNRTGFTYKVTAGGGGSAGGTEPAWPSYIGGTVVDGALTWTCLAIEDTWYAPQGILGTTVTLDQFNNTTSTSTYAYQGTTETVATYKRECITQTLIANTFTTGNNVVTRSGTDSALLTYTGGWNRTDMSTQTGETWLSGQNGCNQGVYVTSNAEYIHIENLNASRARLGVVSSSGGGNHLSIKSCHGNNCGDNGISPANQTYLKMVGVVACMNNAPGIYINSGGSGIHECLALRTDSNGAAFPSAGIYIGEMEVYLNYVTASGNGGYGIKDSSTDGRTKGRITNLTTANNGTYGVDLGTGGLGGLVVARSVLNDTAPFITTGINMGAPGGTGFLHFTNVTGTNVTALHTLIGGGYGGKIESDTTTRHTASGFSWKFSQTYPTVDEFSNTRLSVLKLRVLASTAYNVAIWTRRSGVSIKGRFYARGGQVGGLPNDIRIACEPAINTWVLSSSITFTATEDGVVEFNFMVWDGVSTTNNFWIDDIVVS